MGVTLSGDFMGRGYEKRTYRGKIRTQGLHLFGVCVKETDLWISAGQDLEEKARDLVFQCRYEIESYIRTHPLFKTALQPLPPDPYAPPVVKEMLETTARVGVGPMAAVAGAIAQYVGTGLMEYSKEVIVENGGDIYMQADRPLTVSIFAGDSPLSARIGLSIAEKQMPLGVCTSSGRIGHSLSLGVSHAVTVLAGSAVLADSAATALANTILERNDLEAAAATACDITGIIGGVAILGNTMASWGDVALVGL
jgi:ApbE superfamily uncharacterized protein (UPF0280 family)